MIPIQNMSDRKVAVMGLGRSGLCTAQALTEAGATVRAWDDDADSRSAAEAESVLLAPLAEEDWADVAALVLSPGIPHTHPAPHPAATAARAHGVEIIGDIELLKRSAPDARYIAITGTNGKSTTTALIGHILKTGDTPVQVGGNLGRPALDLDLLESNGYYVLELSSFQLELTPSGGFDIAVLLNITPDHLDRHGGMAGYIAAKRMIFENCSGTAIVGVDDPECTAICAGLRDRGLATVIPVSGTTPVAGGVYVTDGILIDDIDGDRTTIADIGAIATLPGDHNAQNAAAAYATCRAAGIIKNNIVAGLQTYPGLPHRQQLVARIDGVAYVNDSKATNPEAASRALSCYANIYWIAGGRAKEGGLECLTPFLSRIRHAFLIGEAAEPFSNRLEGAVATSKSGTLETAARDAHELAQRDAPQDAVVLLSPACASYDQFPNFEERGREFERLVRNLPGNDRRFFALEEASP